MADLPKGSPERARIEYYSFYFKTVSTVVGNARRTVRWLASLGVILTLRKLWDTGVCLWPNNPKAFALAQLALLCWHLVDNYRWLVINKLVDGDSIRLKKISFSFFSVSALVGSMYYFNELFVAQKTEEKKRVENQRGLAKQACTLVTTLHTSELLLSHDTVCGLAGAIAALITIQDLFPKKPAAPAAPVALKKD